MAAPTTRAGPLSRAPTCITVHLELFGRISDLSGVVGAFRFKVPRVVCRGLPAPREEVKESGFEPCPGAGGVRQVCSSWVGVCETRVLYNGKVQRLSRSVECCCAVCRRVGTGKGGVLNLWCGPGREE